MAATRIILADVPQMLGQILDSVLAGEHDMHVVAHVSREELLHGAAAADVVITGEWGGAAREDFLDVIAPGRRPMVLRLREAARDAFVYEVELSETSLGELSVAELIGVIRARRASPP